MLCTFQPLAKGDLVDHVLHTLNMYKDCLRIMKEQCKNSRLPYLLMIVVQEKRCGRLLRSRRMMMTNFLVKIEFAYFSMGLTHNFDAIRGPLNFFRSEGGPRKIFAIIFFFSSGPALTSVCELFLNTWLYHFDTAARVWENPCKRRGFEKKISTNFLVIKVIKCFFMGLTHNFHGKNEALKFFTSNFLVYTEFTRVYILSLGLTHNFHAKRVAPFLFFF